MKYFFIIILLVAILITTGCVSEDNNTPITPYQNAINAVNTSDEPIVGNWQWTTNDVTKIYKFYFFPDGRYSYTDPINNTTVFGTWDTIQGNVYNVTYLDGRTQTFVYNRTKDTFTIPEFSQVLAYRLGKEPVATIPTTVPTPSPVLYLNGNVEGCFSDNKLYELCVEKVENVSLMNNTVSASVIVLFKPLKGQTFNSPSEMKNYDSLKEVSYSVSLKIYNNESVKVAGVSKSFSVDKNGKTRVELNTVIPEKNPIGWTYRISVEKNPDVGSSLSTTTQPTLRQPTGTVCSVEYYSYRYGSEWTVSGTVRNDGSYGNCEVLAELITTNGIQIDYKSQKFTLSNGDYQSFRLGFVDTTNRAINIKVSIT